MAMTFDEWLKSNPGYYVSPEDLSLATNNENFADTLMKAKTQYYSGGDKVSANSLLENARAMYGNYTAGASGNSFTPTKTYASQYGDKIDALINSITDREEFSYDYEDDPAYQSLLQTAQREGSRAAEDTMGSYAGMTGGLPSTAAVSAAQQQQNYQLSKVQDAIPALYEAAYGRYQNELNNDINTLSAVQGVDNTGYSRYRDTVGDYTNNQQYQDALAQQNLENSMAKDETTYNRVLELLNMGLTTGQTASVLGISEEQATQYANLVKQTQLASLASKTKSSSGGSSSIGTDYTKDVLYSAAKSMWTKEDNTADDIRQYLEDKGASEERIKGIMNALGISDEAGDTSGGIDAATVKYLLDRYNSSYTTQLSEAGKLLRKSVVSALGSNPTKDQVIDWLEKSNAPYTDKVYQEVLASFGIY